MNLEIPNWDFIQGSNPNSTLPNRNYTYSFKNNFSSEYPVEENWSLTGPSWLSIDENGLIYGYPLTEDIGTSNISITVNVSGQEITNNYTLEVKEPCIPVNGYNINTRSDNFCGHEGIDLVNLGQDGHSNYFLIDALTEYDAQWSSSSSNTGASYDKAHQSNNALKIYKQNNPSVTLAAEHCWNKGEGWLMPSYEEIRYLYYNRTQLNGKLDNYSGGWYWFAYETGSSTAYALPVSSGSHTGKSKSNIYKVRCIRYD